MIPRWYAIHKNMTAEWVASVNLVAPIKVRTKSIIFLFSYDRAPIVHRLPSDDGSRLRFGQEKVETLECATTFLCQPISSLWKFIFNLKLISDFTLCCTSLHDIYFKIVCGGCVLSTTVSLNPTPLSSSKYYFGYKTEEWLLVEL